MINDTRVKREIRDGKNLPTQEWHMSPKGDLINRLQYNPDTYLVITSTGGIYTTNEIKEDDEYIRANVEHVVTEHSIP